MTMLDFKISFSYHTFNFIFIPLEKDKDCEFWGVDDDVIGLDGQKQIC